MVSALGLGQIQLESGLNQPFEARIELISPSADELSSLKVGLADPDAFQRAGVERLFVLTNLRFEVKENDNGPDYIRVYSTDAIREPYLNFLVEADWSKGRLYREYTVLLDPPLYNPNARQPVITKPQVQEQETTTAKEEVSVPSQPEQEVSGSSGVSEAAGEGAAATGTPGEYGPTVSSDTLWSIASSTRPDNSISVQQMMMALLQANPDAFIDNNINGLKRGEILRIPNRNEILAMTQADALAEARAQNSAWQEARGAMAATTPTRPVSAAPAEKTGGESQTAATPEESSELRLVAASEKGTGTEKGDTGAAAKSGDSEKALALANEQLQALTSENKDLKDRLTESEGIIKDMKRLVSLKDDELAKLQNQQAAAEQQAEQAKPEEAATTEEAPTTPAAGEEQTTEQETTTAEQAETKPVEKAPAKPEEKSPATKVVEETTPISAPKGIVGQIVDTVMEYKIYIGGGVAGLLILIVGFVFVSRRKKGKAEAIDTMDTAAAAAVSDMIGSEDETILPGEAVEETGAEAATVLPEGADESAEEEEVAAEDETVFAAPGAGAEEEVEAEAEPEPEEDPLAEVNVFLAYEHFDQAEEFVRDAISSNPDNLDFHTKLLEVFYASGDKAKYEEAAKVLHDKVDGQGPHWDMTVAMWSEMSPGRALFEEGAAEEETTAAETTGVGMLDLTGGEAEESAGGAGDMDLDFDLGDTTDVPAGSTEEQEEDLLDVTAAVSMTDTGSDEDLLDVTAAVGLEPDLGSASESDEEMLDITAGAAEEPEEDLLDVSATSGDSLLDVTAQSDTDSLTSEEDLLDVTAATSAGADSEELLEVSDAAEAPVEEEDNSLDFDIGGLDVPEAEEPAAEPEETMQLDVGGAEEESAGNVIEFESAVSGTAEDEGEGEGEKEGDGLDLNLPDEAGEEEGLEFDIGLQSEEEAGEETGKEEGDIDLSIDDSSLYTDAETMDIKLDDSEAGALEAGAEETLADEGLDIDLDIGDSDEAEIPSLDVDQDEGGVELDLTLDEAADAGGGLELEMDTGDAAVSENEDDEALEETVKIPEIDLDFDMDEEDDDEEHTVFVPRAGADEQSEEDEVATKLDLAKAYVELGDKDSAKGILEEIINEGNEQQKATAQDLLKQVS